MWYNYRMRFWSWSKSRAKNTFAVIELGSASVSGALFGVSADPQDKTYQIINTAHAEICAREADISLFLDGVRRALTKVLDDLGKKRGELPAKYFCILSSPFYVTRIEHLTEIREKPFLVTEPLVVELADKQAAELGAKEPLLYASLVGDRNIVIESKVMQIRLNGYEIREPFGKEARQLDFSQYVSLGSERVINLLRQIIKDQTQTEPEFHSFAYCEYHTLRDLHHFNDNFLIVDVGGGVTDLTLVSAGRIVDNDSFPLGQDFLIRWLAEAWSTTETEMASILKLYLDGRAEPKIKNKIEALLVRIKADWTGQFRGALARSAREQIIPPKIFVIGNSEEAMIFLQWLKAEDLSAFTLVPKTVTVDFVDQKTFSAFYRGETSRLRDTFLLADGLFCGRIFRARYFNT